MRNKKCGSHKDNRNENYTSNKDVKSIADDTCIRVASSFISVNKYSLYTCDGFLWVQLIQFVPYEEANSIGVCCDISTLDKVLYMPKLRTKFKNIDIKYSLDCWSNNMSGKFSKLLFVNGLLSFAFLSSICNFFQIAVVIICFSNIIPTKSVIVELYI